MGVNVAVVLFVGILASGIIGLCVGSCGFFEWIQAIGSGMSDMFSISIVAILVSGIIGLVREYGGVEWLVGAISSKIKSRTWCGIWNRTDVRYPFRSYGK